MAVSKMTKTVRGEAPRDPAASRRGWAVAARRAVAAAALLMLAPAVLPAAAAEGEWQVAQFTQQPGSSTVADLSVRVDRVEGQMRTLTGQIEELTFHIRQLQEQLRRMQEDNEFRFQQLEGAAPVRKKSDAAPAGGTTVAEFSDPPGAPGGLPGSDLAGTDLAGTDLGGTDLSGAGLPGTGLAGADLGMRGEFSDTAGSSAGTGAPPASLGTLAAEAAPPGPYDPAAGPLDLTAMTTAGVPAAPPPAAGQPLPGIGAEQAPLSDMVPDTAAGTQTAALPAATNAREIYDGAYNHILRGEYPQAEVQFRRFLDAYPSDRLAPDAQYWLGETLFARADYRDAAQSFLKSYSEHPDSRKAPDALFKLGMSLAGMGEKEAACASYSELLQRYPSSSQVLKDRVRSEQKGLKC